MRELWNTSNTVDVSLPFGELDGCRFGLEPLQRLLDQPGCEDFTKSTSDEINQKVFDAFRSAEPSERMAEFVRWATDAYMDFLDTRGRYSESAAQWGLLKMRSVRNRLLVNTSEVDRSVQLDDSDDDVNFRHDRMLEILSHLFNAIIDHHKKVSNSRVGVEEVLLLAEESDFVNRRTNNYTTLHKKFAIDEGHGLPMDYRLTGITMANGKQVKQRGHLMPIEYTIEIIAPVIPRLDHDVLVLLPLQKWSRWLEEVSLQPIGEKLATEISGRLHPQAILATPNNTAGPSVYNTARSHQRSSAGEIAANADMEELGSPSNEEQGLSSHHTSLSGSRHAVLLSTPVPPLENLIARPFKLALPPTPLDQKRRRQEESGQVLKKARSLPGNTATR